MLIAHAASTCDVCLEGYHEDCSYHSIPCGHVFCLPCLVSTSPPRCPLCRHEFTPYSMRKVHLTLPSERDMAARRFELKLVQSSPEMTLAESLMLFQEVQEWLEGEAQDEFLVLRAFAAVMCGFHETKDKLLQTETRAEKNEALLLRSLDEARNAPNTDKVDYKSKYQVTKSEVTALRAECSNLRAQVEQAQQRSVEIQAHYAQAQAYTQSQSLSESLPAARRTSNPLPTPPRPIEIPFLKLIEAHPSLYPQEIKGKAKEIAMSHPDADDPMTSAFVPTLASIQTRNSSSSADVRSEVTTLVFKPPKRMPVWNFRNLSYSGRMDASESIPNHTYSDSSSRPDPYLEAKSPGSGYSRMNELPQIAREPSNLSLGQSENASYQSVSYAHPGAANPVAGSVLANPPPQPQAYANDREHGQNPLPGQKAAVPPIRDESSPHAASNLPLSTLPTSFAPSMVPTTSRSGARGVTTSGVKLRRASSPVVWLSDPGEPTYHTASGRLLPYSDWRGSETRTVQARTRTRGAVDDSLSHVKVNGRIPRHASPSRSDRRRMDGVQVMDDILPQMQDEYVSSRRNQSTESPPSPRSTGYVDSRKNHGTPMSPDRSQSMTPQDHQAFPSAQPPLPVRERAHSHSHHAIPTISLNRHPNAYAMSPISGRLPLDISIAGPGETFPMINPDRPRAAPVAEV